MSPQFDTEQQPNQEFVAAKQTVRNHFEFKREYLEPVVNSSRENNLAFASAYVELKQDEAVLRCLEGNQFGDDPYIALMALKSARTSQASEAKFWKEHPSETLFGDPASTYAEKHTRLANAFAAVANNLISSHHMEGYTPIPELQ